MTDARTLLEALKAVQSAIDTGTGKGMLAAVAWRDALVDASCALDDIFDEFHDLLAAAEADTLRSRVAELEGALRGLVDEAQAVRGSHGHRSSCDRDHRDVPIPVGSYKSCATLTEAIRAATTLLAATPTPATDEARCGFVFESSDGPYICGAVERIHGEGLGRIYTHPFQPTPTPEPAP